MRKIVLISGKICTGKSGLAKRLVEDFDFHLVQTSVYLKKLAVDRGIEINRHALQELGDTIDVETAHKWVLDLVLKEAANLKSEQPIVLDNIRNSEQLEHFRKHYSCEIVHVHLYAPNAVLEARFQEVCASSNSQEEYDDANILKEQKDIEKFREEADVRINTGRSNAGDNLVRVAARLNLYSSPDAKCVDVIIGGQYGSEGKGNIAAYLAKEYDVLLRVGGPNAGHTVSSSSGVYTYHQLPSGCRDTQAEILLGPGMTINVSKLCAEIADCEIKPNRLYIDPQAMIIQEEDIEVEVDLKASIASTGQGGGAAAARKILGRKQGLVKLAKDIPELEQYVGVSSPYRGSTSTRLEKAYREGLSILLEGTQGSGLSLYHGHYPYVTSRDTNVSGCLAEAGIPPSRVRKTLLVIRYTPIRVANPDDKTCALSSVGIKVKTMFGIKNLEKKPKIHSGPLKHETTFNEVSKLAGLDPENVNDHEKTSTTKRKRRVGWFDWELFRRSCTLNAPTDIVFTFADYIDAKNQNARRFEQLSVDTIKYIEELERVAQAPVSLISTRFPRDTEKLDLRNIIDRRYWTTRKIKT